MSTLSRKISALRRRALRPLHARRVLSRQPQPDSAHLRATLGWLCEAQDQCGGRGVSIQYDVHRGWHPDPYPETTGYILSTFLTYASWTGAKCFRQRAETLGQWELEIQRADGAVLSSVREDTVRVFNTGQVILGWCHLFEQTKATRYLEGAARAGAYLRSRQDDDGAWRVDTHCGPRTYHSRVAWALMRLAELSGESRFREAAGKSLSWVLSQQQENGWFAQCGFDCDPPITHVIGYTVRGLLECAAVAARNGWEATVGRSLLAASSTCQALVRCVEANCIDGISGLLPAAFDSRWNPTDDTACLTGNAQLALCLMRLPQLSGQEAARFTGAASLLLEALKRTQILRSPNAGLRGGVAGSYPPDAGYVHDAYPNWAAKFMADALMMRMSEGAVVPQS